MTRSARRRIARIVAVPALTLGLLAPAAAARAQEYGDEWSPEAQQPGDEWSGDNQQPGDEWSGEQTYGPEWYGEPSSGRRHGLLGLL
jgi:hypothetical protein